MSIRIDFTNYGMSMNVKTNKKAFTLLEIVIVIVIIWVLMWATMKFGWDRIGFLNNKNVKEQFMASYDKLYSDNMMTSYYLGDIYKNLDINFAVWSDDFGYVYKWYNTNYSWSAYVDGWNYKIKNLSISGDDITKLSISFVPYVFWCKINWLDTQDTQIVKIDILVNNSKNYCFEINSDNCRIQKIVCD